MIPQRIFFVSRGITVLTLTWFSTFSSSTRPTLSATDSNNTIHSHLHDHFSPQISKPIIHEYVVWRLRWPVHWTVHLPAKSEGWHSKATFLQREQSALLQKGPSTRRTTPYIQSIVKQLLTSSSLTEGLGVAVRKTGHHGHRNWMRFIRICGVTWKVSRRHTNTP